MKDFYCPLCGEKHSADKDEMETVCKCGKTLIVKLTKNTIEIKLPGVTFHDLKTE